MPRVVIDTNIFIRSLLGSSIAQRLIDNLNANKFHLITSIALLNEFIEAARDKELAAFITEEDIAEVVALIEERGLFIKPHREINACRDPEDDFILELAVDSHANFILTHDKDLLSLNPFHKVEIIRPKEFLERL